MQLKTSHGGKPGHLVPAVDDITGICDIIQHSKEFQGTDYFISQLHIEQYIILMLHITGNIQSAYPPQLRIHMNLGNACQPIPRKYWFFGAPVRLSNEV